MRVLNRSSARRTSTWGVKVGVVISGPSGRWCERGVERAPGAAGARPAGPAGKLGARVIGWSGVLDRGDLELEDDLVADEHTAGLQRGVPGDPVVLAADGDRAFEANAGVAERVARGALGGERDRDRVRDALDGQVAGELERGVVDLARAGGDERDLRVVVHREEVVAAQVLVALRVAGVDAGGLDRDRCGGGGRVGAVE